MIRHKKAIEDTIRHIDRERPLFTANIFAGLQKTYAQTLWSTLTTRELQVLKKHYQPVDFTISTYTRNDLLLTSKLNFDTLKVSLVWQVYKANAVIKEGLLSGLQLLPGKEEKVAIPFDLNQYTKDPEVVFKFSMHLAAPKAWAPKEFEVAGEEFTFSQVNGHPILLKNK